MSVVHTDYSSKEVMAHYGRSDRRISYADFFRICSSFGKEDKLEIADLFLISEQTVHNWRKKIKDGQGDQLMPGWVFYSLFALRALDAQPDAYCVRAMPDFPQVSVDWFKDWQRRNGLRTYHQTGQVFAVSRQAVHNWFCRNRFPQWIALSCIGYDLYQAASESGPLENGR